MEHLHRWYMQVRYPQSGYTEYWLDEMYFYSTQDTPEPDQNDESITSVWVGYFPSTDKWQIFWQDQSFETASGENRDDFTWSTFQVKWSTSPITNENWDDATPIDAEFYSGPKYTGSTDTSLVRAKSSWGTMCWTQFELPDNIESGNSKIYFAIKDMSASGQHIGTSWPWNRPSGDAHDAPSPYIHTIDYSMRPGANLCANGECNPGETCPADGCCGGQEYDTVTQECCSGSVVTGDCCSNQECPEGHVCNHNNLCEPENPIPANQTGLCSEIELLLHFNNEIEHGETPELVYDFSGNGNNASCSGSSCPTWKSGEGRFGGAFEFDGLDDFLDLGDNVEPPGEMTISLWAKPTRDQTNTVLLAKYTDFPAEYEIMIGEAGTYIARSDQGHSYYDPILAYDTDHHTSYPDWVHIVGVYDKEDRMKISINGQFKSQGDVFTRDTNRDDPLTIGKRSFPGAEAYFQGLIDELAIWNLALNQSEVQNLYSSGREISCRIHRADTQEPFNFINMGELLEFIGLWKSPGTDILMTELMDAIRIWESG
jgi:hypothetical protein